MSRSVRRRRRPLGVVEAVANFLWEADAPGVVEAGEGAGVGLRAFFPPAVDPAGLRTRLVRYLDELRALAVPVGDAVIEVRRLPGEAWAEAWRAHFRRLARDGVSHTAPAPGRPGSRGGSAAAEAGRRA